jgi:hypothetical protein
MSGVNETRVGAISFGPAQSTEDSMARSIVSLLAGLAKVEARLAKVEAERDFYKAAAGKLAKGGRKK